MGTDCITTVKNGIYNCNDFIAFLEAVHQGSSLQPWQDEKGVVNLMNDINLQEKEIPYVSSFKDTFDGNNHTISGLRIVEAESDNSTLFGTLEKNGIIRNLKFIGSINASRSSSGITGDNNGLILNCSFKGDHKGPEYLGGIASYNKKSGIIIGCTYEGNILGGEVYSSGITSINEGIISKCCVNATIQSEGYTGLITGFNYGKISKCTCAGSVVCKSGYHGGLTGYNDGEIANCDCNCNFPIESISSVGGITSYNNGRISGCTFAGETQTQEFGGIAGHNYGEIISCTCKRLKSDLCTEETQIGGIVRYNDTKGSIFSCHTNDQLITARKNVGRIAYSNSGTINGCTWNGPEQGKGVIEGADSTIRINVNI